MERQNLSAEDADSFASQQQGLQQQAGHRKVRIWLSQDSVTLMPFSAVGIGAQM